MDIKEFFKDLHKGEIEIVNEHFVSWKLGELVLDFSDNDYECICVVYRNVKHKTFHQITHIHVDYSLLPNLLKDIDNPNRKICIHRILFGLIGTSFRIVDISYNKKFRIYSI